MLTTVCNVGWATNTTDSSNCRARIFFNISAQSHFNRSEGGCSISKVGILEGRKAHVYLKWKTWDNVLQWKQCQAELPWASNEHSGDLAQLQWAFGMKTTKIAELTEILLTGFMSAYLLLIVFRTALKNKTWQTIFLRDLDFNYHFTNRKISRVGFVCLAVIRLEAPGLNFLLSKPAFTKGSMAIMAFEQMSTSPHGFVAGRVIQWLKCQLLSFGFNLIIANTS